MIILDAYHNAVRDAVLTNFSAYKEYLKTNDKTFFPRSVSTEIADFDGVLYRIQQAQDEKLLTVSIFLSFYTEIETFGAAKLLRREYGNFYVPRPEDGASVTLVFDYDKLPENIEELATKVALLRRNCIASVFEHFFDYQMTQPSKNIQGTINFRADETIFLQAMSDRVTVIFSTRFKDASDIVLGKVFLQEFSETKRRFDSAPQVLYCHRDPPRELSGTNAASGDNVAYITFVLSPRHLSEKTRTKTIDLVYMFRTYMHYHIKCMKAFLQMRMRAKTYDFLKVLNRAHQRSDGDCKLVVNTELPDKMVSDTSHGFRAMRVGK